MKLTNIIEREYKNVTVETILSTTDSKAANELCDILAEWLIITKEKMHKQFEESITDHIILYKDIAHPLAEEMIKNTEYTQNDITIVGLSLDRFHSSDYFPVIGVFLSELINNHKQKNEKSEEYKLILQDFGEHVMCIGFLTDADINVLGNTGMGLGACMKGGKITLTGNTDHDVGKYMTGGRIQIKGNAKSCVGNSMFGGEIIVYGETSHSVGFNQQGGKIYLEGPYKTAPHNTFSFAKNKKGGEIYHKRVRIS